MLFHSLLSIYHLFEIDSPSISSLSANNQFPFEQVQRVHPLTLHPLPLPMSGSKMASSNKQNKQKYLGNPVIGPKQKEAQTSNTISVPRLPQPHHRRLVFVPVRRITASNTNRSKRCPSVEKRGDRKASNCWDDFSEEAK